MCIVHHLKAYHTLIAILFGIMIGLNILPFSLYMIHLAELLSDIFMRLLKLVSLPIIFLSITTTISGLDSHHTLKTTGLRVLRYTLATTISAATIALILFLVIDPANEQLVFSSQMFASTEGQLNYLEYLANIVPSNMILAFSENNVLGILFIASSLGMASLALPNVQKQTLHQLFSSLYSAIFKLTSWILKLVPIAIWAFVTVFVHSILAKSLPYQLLSLYLLCVVSANIIQATLVLPLLLFYKGINPLKTFQQMLPALQIAFWSKSSSAALPACLENIKRNTDVHPNIANISLPLCISINMNGCAAFILITVFFVAQCHGVSFNFFSMIAWIFIATLTAVGNAGVPMGCYFLSCTLLSSMGVPLQIMGFILPFYVLIDMLESAINVWSDICVTLAVNQDDTLSINQPQRVH